MDLQKFEIFYDLFLQNQGGYIFPLGIPYVMVIGKP